MALSTLIWIGTTTPIIKKYLEPQNPQLKTKTATTGNIFSIKTLDDGANHNDFAHK